MTPDRETLAAALRQASKRPPSASHGEAFWLEFADALLPLLAPPPSEGEADEAAGRVAASCARLIAEGRLSADNGPVADLRLLLADRERLTYERDEARDVAFLAACGPDAEMDRIKPSEWLAEVRRLRGKWPNDPANDDIYQLLDDIDAGRFGAPESPGGEPK